MDKIDLRTNKLETYGKELILNLYDCDGECITSKERLKQYVDELCELIRMKKYGELIIERFGFGKDYSLGYSLVQLIETSSIVAHFSEKRNSAYINIFSCQDFDEEKALEFTKNFFKAKKTISKVLIR